MDKLFKTLNSKLQIILLKIFSGAWFMLKWALNLFSSVVLDYISAYWDLWGKNLGGEVQYVLANTQAGLPICLINPNPNIIPNYIR